MDATALKQVLSRLNPVPDKTPELEQYQTSPAIAANVLHTARLHGDVEDKEVVDLGCGNGIFAIGAAVLGATAHGYDVDEQSVAAARDNAAAVEEQLDRELAVSFTVADVREIADTADTVIMNPPFGLQRGNDDMNLVFLDVACGIADTVYALLHRSEQKAEETQTFVARHAAEHGRETMVLDTVDFPLPRTFAFQQTEKKHIKVDLYKFSRRTDDGTADAKV